MAMIDKVNGKIRVNCIIMNRGVIPNFAGVMGPILQPRPIELNEVLLLLKMGVDLRAVDRNKDFKLEEAIPLNELNIRQMVDDFKHGKKPIEAKKPIHQPKQQPVVQEQPKQVEQPKPVVQEQPVQEQPKQVEQPKPVVQEQPVQEQPKQSNKNNKNNKKK